MLKKIISSPLFYPLLLTILCLFIAFKNYTPNTFLTGWDTLHPEFNFSKNFKDLIFGVWRSDQGLGAVAGHSHMADLPRVIFLWLLHFTVPLSFLRYSYIFVCLILGTLGFYFLIKFLFKKPLIAFLGALVYLFNLGTLQQFFVPFEMFPTQWAFLPWIIFSALNYLHQPSKKMLLIFSLFTLLSTPQAYAAQLWYAFFAVFTLFLLLSHSKKALILFLITLALNSFWLLPNLYYVATQSDNPTLNLSNRLHSQEYLLRNQQTGTLADTSLLKGFYFNWEAYNFSQNASNPLMPVWISHLANYDVLLIGNLLFLFSFIGLVIVFVTKNRRFLPLTPFFIIPFILLANRMPVFNLIFDFLLKIPVVQEAIRFIFTKFSILFTFGYALFFTFFLNFLLTTFPRLLRSVSVILPLSLIIYCYPYFTGNLISPIVRVNIPSSYFDLNTYLQNSPDGRILSLPLNSPDGWAYNDWGYQGSGFVWFGFPEALLDRDSDRWQSKNEEAYREFFTALYANDSTSFLNYLQKYRIGYILWDHSLVPTSPKNRDQTTQKDETTQLINQLTQSNYLKTPQIFGSVELYSTNLHTALVQSEQLTNFVGSAFRWHYSDPQAGTDYLTSNTSRDISFPFRQILTPENKVDPTILRSLPITASPTVLFSGSKEIFAGSTSQGFAVDQLDLPHNSGYLIGLKTRYLTGVPPRLCVYNLTADICTVQEEITKDSNSHWDYFLVPPQDNYYGYQIQLNTIGYDFSLSQSTLEELTLTPIDYSSLSSFSSSSYQPQAALLNPSSFISLFPNHSLIKVQITDSPADSHLLLNQSFDQGWLAFYFQNHQIKFLSDHFLANNWANSWSLPQNTSATVYLFFWPQTLEFLGFLLIPLTLFLYKKQP